MPTTRGYSYVSAPAANPPLHSCLAGIGARLNGHGCNQCGPNYACTPAQPVCYPGHAGVPCTYDGPILGVSRSGFTDYYRCSPCYRRLWENYGAERQRCCIENHGHLRGDCGCSNGCGYALPCGQAGACGQPGCGCGQAAAPAADCGCQNPHAANARGANPQATAPATR